MTQKAPPPPRPRRDFNDVMAQARATAAKGTDAPLPGIPAPALPEPLPVGPAGMAEPQSASGLSAEQLRESVVDLAAVKIPSFGKPLVDPGGTPVGRPAAENLAAHGLPAGNPEPAGLAELRNVAPEEPAAPVTTPIEAPRKAPEAPRAQPFHVDESLVITQAGTLQVFEALKRATAGTGGPFNITALQSGYIAEVGPLSFRDIAKLQSATLDNYARRNRLLETVWSKISKFSCGPVNFNTWKKITAQGDWDSLMYGLYAATYPGDNEFEVNCRHCGHTNKLVVDVNRLVRAINTEETFTRVKELLEKQAYQGPPIETTVGKTSSFKLPASGIVAEIRNPTLEDQMLGLQYMQSITDKQTGMTPEQLAGAETIRTLVMYTNRLLVPAGGGGSYVAITMADAKADAIGKLNRVDGMALAAAVDDEARRYQVAYEIPAFDCQACSKRNTDLQLNFEALLFIRLQESA